MPETTAHPSQEQLSAYNLGQLPPEEAVAIESHISECEPCCNTIVELSSDDTFVGLLKEARQLPTDQAVDHDAPLPAPSSTLPEVPSSLAEHPRYEILSLIGKGGMGDVYMARHRMMDRTVALKIIKRELTRKSEAVNRFHREVKTAAQLSHPNIVTAYDAEQAGDVHFMVMEYVDGVNLAQTVQERGALPIGEACDYVRQAAIGLQQAHEQGMVHRDIKPHNLMVTANGTVKILDFGLASLAPEASSEAGGVTTRGDLTAIGAIMGTPDFISPEQADDARTADIRSDIYSLGSTFYFLLAGRPPFADGSVTQKLDSHAHAEPEPLESLRDGVPPELVAVVTKMTAKDPHERYLTPSEVADALQSFLRAWRPDDGKSLGQEPSSGGNLSGSGGQKSGTGDARPDWLLVLAKGLFYVAWIPVALICYELWAWNEATAVGAGYRTGAYMLVTLCLSCCAGVAFGMHKYKSQSNQLNRDGGRIFTWTASETLLIAAILVAAVVAYKFSFSASEGFSLVAGGAGCDGDGWYVSSGSTYLKQDEPGVLFGMCENPEGDRSFSYVVLFHHEANELTEVSSASKTGLQFDGETASIRDGLTIDGKDIELDLEMQMDRQDIKATEILINGKATDASQGRLFLVDLTSDGVTWNQVNAKFPHDLPAPQAVVGDTKLVSKVARQIIEQLANDNVKVRKFLAGAAIQTDDNTQKQGVQSTDSEFPPEIAAILAKSGQPEAEFRKKLNATLSQAAGIPNGEWETFATDPRGSTAAIEGEPLSLLLMSLNPPKASKDNPDAVKDFRLLTNGMPKPNELHKAMATSQPHGYVSAIQPEYIKDAKVDIDPDTGLLRGSVEFEAPDLYAGKVDFALGLKHGRMQVVEFALPNYGVTIARDEKGVWRRAAVTVKHDTTATDLDRFQGTWRMTAAVPYGKAPPREKFESESGRWIFTDDKLVQDYNGKIKESGFQLHPSSTPKGIDLVLDGVIGVIGIYELKGDTLRICFKPNSLTAKRPTEFESKAVSDTILLTFKKAEEEQDIGDQKNGKTIKTPAEENAPMPAESEASAERKTTAFLIESAKRGDTAAVEAVLKAGIDPNGPANQLTALHWAVAQRLVDGETIEPSPEIVKLLIDAGADVNAEDYLGQTPLEWAAKFAPLDIVQMLITAGADVNAESRYGTILMAGSRVEIAKLLIKAGADVNDGQYMTPLAQAAKYGNVEMIRLLIDKGAVVNEPKNPPIHWAGKPEVAKVLLEANADVNQRNAKGETALHLAKSTWSPNAETVKLLIESGADVKAKDATGSTPLHAAVQLGKPEIAKLLVAAGADVDAKDRQGNTPLSAAHGAVSWAHGIQAVDNKPYEAAVKLLIDAGAKDDGRTKLQQAVAVGDLDQVKKLIASKVNVNETGPQRITAIHLASEKGHAKILAALIEAGGKVDDPDAHGIRPLHLAADAETARLLIANGATVNSRMPSPLYMATMNGKADVVRELLRNDANARDSDCATMLNWATFAGQLEVINALFELRDAEALLKVPSTYSPLHVAASGSLGDMNSPDRVTPQRRLAIATLLVEKGANVNARWGRNLNPLSGAAHMVGTTPLMFAALKGDAEMIKFLVDLKADPQATNASGETALHFAAQYGHRAVVELLLKAKAEVNALTREAKTPLDLTQDAGVKVLLLQNGGKTASELLKDSKQYEKSK